MSPAVHSQTDSSSLVKITLGTATPGGGFPVYGDAFIAAVRAQDPTLVIDPINTKGSTENVPRLEAGTLDIALVQGEVVHEALSGVRDAFRARELNARCEGIQLLHGRGFDQAEVRHVRHQRSHAVIAQTARVNSRRNERAAQRVHFDERRQMPRVAKIVGEPALRKAGTRGGLHRDHARLTLPFDFSP